MASIWSQTIPPREVIVVNDGSTDGTDEWLQRMSTQHKIVVVRTEAVGPAAARNAGIRMISTPYVAFLDDDCVASSRWLERLTHHLKTTNVDIVGGRVELAERGRLCSEVSQEVVNFFTSQLHESKHGPTFLTSNNVAYRTEALRTVGGFDERFLYPGGEDRALHMKLVSHGFKSSYEPTAIVRHFQSLGLRDYVRQQKNYGRGAYVLHRIVQKELTSVNSKIPLRLYVQLFNTLLHSDSKGVQKALLFLIGQQMVVLGFVSEAFRFFIHRLGKAEKHMHSLSYRSGRQSTP